ncbi:UPF0415 protein C7orf25 homolog [Lineus longissimus]|uniref:UPF0415 protein C7orf25 homolog n=1 Tax=Lineus longissimus TaxID=88925 RepID=UPI002B4E76CA
MAEKQPAKSALSVVNDFIAIAEDLIFRTAKIDRVQGAAKFQRKCRAELRFLTKLKTRKDVSESHVRSSNLTQLHGTLLAAETLPHVTHILQPYHHMDKGFVCNKADANSVLVDVVCQNGSCWVKVIARKAQGLHNAWAGHGQFGQRNIVDQADEYMQYAKQNLVKYIPPKVVFLFISGVTAPIAKELEERGILVHGERLDAGVEVFEQLGDESDLGNDSDCFEGEENSDEGCDLDMETSAIVESQKRGSYKKLTDTESDNNEKGDVGGLSTSVSVSVTTVTSGADSSCSVLNDGASVSSGVAASKPAMSPITLASFDEKEFSHSMKQIILRLGASLCEEDEDQYHEQNREKDNASSWPNISCHTGAQMSTGLPLTLPSLLPAPPVIRKVNFDITTLICMVSNLTHGGCDFVFKEQILTDQARQERERPLLPKLLEFIKDKECYACETAIGDFLKILKTVGGPNERRRADHLLKTVEVVHDSLSEKSQKLQATAHVNERAKVIFGTGDNLQAITLTANQKFVRAAGHQGVSFVVFPHEPRALTEQKELTATPITETGNEDVTTLQ